MSRKESSPDLADLPQSVLAFVHPKCRANPDVITIAHHSQFERYVQLERMENAGWQFGQISPDRDIARFNFLFLPDPEVEMQPSKARVLAPQQPSHTPPCQVLGHGGMTGFTTRNDAAVQQLRNQIEAICKDMNEKDKYLKNVRKDPRFMLFDQELKNKCKYFLGHAGWTFGQEPVEDLLIWELWAEDHEWLGETQPVESPVPEGFQTSTPDTKLPAVQESSSGEALYKIGSHEKVVEQVHEALRRPTSQDLMGTPPLEKPNPEPKGRPVATPQAAALHVPEVSGEPAAKTTEEATTEPVPKSSEVTKASTGEPVPKSPAGEPVTKSPAEAPTGEPVPKSSEVTKALTGEPVPKSPAGEPVTKSPAEAPTGEPVPKSSEVTKALTGEPVPKSPAGEPVTKSPETEAPSGEPVRKSSEVTKASTGEPVPKSPAGEPTKSPETEAPTGEPVPKSSEVTKASTGEPVPKSPAGEPVTKSPEVPEEKSNKDRKSPQLPHMLISIFMDIHACIYAADLYWERMQTLQWSRGQNQLQRRCMTCYGSVILENFVY